MIIKHTRAYLFCSVIALVAPNLFAAESDKQDGDIHSSSQLPLAEKNQLQQTPEYTGTDQDIIEPLPDLVLAEPEPEEEAEYQTSFTNSAWEQFDVPESFYDNPYTVSLFSPTHGEDSERLLSQTNSIFYYGLGVISALAVMPESVTNWNSDDDDSFAQKWIDNVTDGPVWDRDDVVLNYVMHPYFGGAYYQAARKSGYRQWDSFLYSALMSTVFWEYGVEAFAETPSMQDIVVTPVLGWVYGEWAFNKEREIWARGGTVMGSEYLGNTALFLLDPIDSIGRNFNRLFGADLIKAGTGYIRLTEQGDSGNIPNDKQIMFQINYAIGNNTSPAQSGISGRRKVNEGYSFGHSKDPVDTGIIGLSLGSGYVNFDNKRKLINQQYAQFSLGLYFTRAFSARLNYNSTQLFEGFVDPDYTYESFSVDGQYYFNSQANLRPYITAGIGEEIWDKDDDQYNLQINAGVGLHYRLNEKWAVQADLINYFTSDEGSHDQLLTGKIIYRFGEGEK